MKTTTPVTPQEAPRVCCLQYHGYTSFELFGRAGSFKYGNRLLGGLNRMCSLTPPPHTCTGVRIRQKRIQRVDCKRFALKFDEEQQCFPEWSGSLEETSYKKNDLNVSETHTTSQSGVWYGFATDKVRFMGSTVQECINVQTCRKPESRLRSITFINVNVCV